MCGVCIVSGVHAVCVVSVLCLVYMVCAVSVLCLVYMCVWCTWCVCGVCIVSGVHVSGVHGVCVVSVLCLVYMSTWCVRCVSGHTEELALVSVAEWGKDSDRYQDYVLRRHPSFYQFSEEEVLRKESTSSLQAPDLSEAL